MSSFHFYRWNPFKVIPLECTLRARNFPIFSATSDVRYWVNHIRRRAAWRTTWKKSMPELETVNK